MRENAFSVLRGVMRRNPVFTALFALLVVAVTLAGLLPPLLLRSILDGALVTGDADRLPLLGGLLVGAYALAGLLDFGKSYMLNAAGQRIVHALRSSMARKLARVRVGYFTQNAAGTVASRFLNDVDAIAALFSDGVIGMAIDCCKLLGVIVSVWVFSVRLGVFTLLLLPVIAVLTAFFRKRILHSQKKNLAELARVNRHLGETLRCLRMIKSSSKEDYMRGGYESVLRDNFATMDRVNRYDACYSPLIQMLTAFAVSAVLLLACDGGNALGVTIGTLAATISLVTGLFEPVDNLGTELQGIQTGMAGIRGVDEFLAEEDEVRAEEPLALEQLREHGARLCFEHVVFSYDGDAPVLDGVDLTIEPGERLCIVGRTGVGKTTTFRLITGLLAPKSGRVTLNGMDVRGIPASQRRAVFGYVQQSFAFVHGNIAEQISLGDPAISQADVERAMRFVGLHEHVLALPEGYRTDASDGGMFSQGQKQLLCIARAIASDPCVLLLDEVTASLDSATEAAVVSVLKRLGREKTVLSIAHRASSMLDADRIALMRDGRVQAVGTPDEMRPLLDNSAQL